MLAALKNTPANLASPTHLYAPTGCQQGKAQQNSTASKTARAQAVQHERVRLDATACHMHAGQSGAVAQFAH